MGKIRGVKVIEAKGTAESQGVRREVVGGWSKKGLNLFRQLTVERNFSGAIKAFYLNRKANVSIYCVKGMIELVIYDGRVRSGSKGNTQIEMLGDYRTVCVVIPKGITFGYKVVGTDDAFVIWGYNQRTKESDETVIDKNSPEIGFDWSVKPR